MADHVLEFLDGPRAGESVPLDASRPARLGRRDNNDIVLTDEKASGKHAEIVREDGGWVLRDLDSTNGTLMDGKSVREVALTSGDIFQVGKTRMCFRGVDDKAPTDAMQVHTVNQDAMARAKKKGQGSSFPWAMVALLVAAAGAGAWLFLKGDDTNEGGQQRTGPAAVMDVAGNRLDANAASLEEPEVLEGKEAAWLTRPLARAAFRFTASEYAHSGIGAAEAVHAEGAELSDAGDAFAILRASEPFIVSAGSVVQLTGFAVTEGSARVSLRARFTSELEGDPFVYTTGTPFTAVESGGDYQEMSFSVGVPRGVNQLAVEVYAEIPASGDAVFVDDLAVTVGSGEGEQPAFDVRVEKGESVVGCGGALAVHTVDVDDPALLLALEPVARVAHGFAALGGSFDVSAEGGSFAIRTDGVDGSELRLRLPGASAGGFAIAEQAAAEGQPLQFRAMQPAVPQDAPVGVAAVLFGSGSTRAMIEFGGGAEAGTQIVQLTARETSQGYFITLRDVPTGGLRLSTDFREQARKARDLVTRAERAQAGERLGEALGLLAEVETTLPHDTDALREAQKLRGSILTAQARATESLRADLATAEFFATRGGFERVLGGIASLRSRYGVDWLSDAELLDSLESGAKSQLAALDATRDTERRERLGRLAKAFDDAKQKDLAGLVRDYLTRHGAEGK